MFFYQASMGTMPARRPLEKEIPRVQSVPAMQATTRDGDQGRHLRQGHSPGISRTWVTF